MRRRMSMRTYNDGVMEVAKRKDTSSNIREKEELEVLYKLFYRYTSIRQQDYEFAEQIQTNLTLKVATQDNGVLDTDCMAVIGDIAYSIIHIDKDQKNKELYFYLEEARKFEHESDDKGETPED